MGKGLRVAGRQCPNYSRLLVWALALQCARSETGMRRIERRNITSLDCASALALETSDRHCISMLTPIEITEALHNPLMSLEA